MLSTIVSFSGEPMHETVSDRTIDAGYTVFEPQAVRAPHAHEGLYELLFVQNGQGRIELEGKIYIANEGDLVIYSPGAMHLEDWRGTQNLPLVFYCILDEAFSRPADREIAERARRYPVLPAGEYARQISRLWWALDHECRAPKACSAEISQCLTASLLMLVRRLLLGVEPQSADAEGESIARQARQYIEAHCTERLTLSGIADALHVSLYHLSHEFKKETGESPIHYLNLLRIERAQMLLRTTTYSVQEIVFRVGFENIPNFNLLFKRQTGLTPSQYRKRHNEILLGFKEE